MKNHKLSADALRFIIGGIANTAFTYVIFLLVLQVSSYTIAYCVSWAVGILFVVIVYPSRVFVGSKASPVKRVISGLQYILVFFLGLAFLRLLVEYFMLGREISMLATIVFTTVINFLLMRLIMRGSIGVQ
jgi:putative flippase GtrA